MSAVKFKFVGLLRGLFRRQDGAEVSGQEEANEFETSQPVTAAQPVQNTLPPEPEAQPVLQPAPINADEIQVPLSPILSSLPMELRAKIMPANTAGMTIMVPVDRVVSQLATGSVTLTFGELRHLAPGVFANSGGEHDSKPVVLPLNYVLAQLNPALLARRAAQKQIKVSDDISSPFDAHGQGLKISTDLMKAPPAPAQPAAPVPLARLSTPLSPAGPTPPPVVPPPAFNPRWNTPATHANGNGNGHSNGNGNGNGNGHANGNGSNGVNGSRKVSGFDTSIQPAAPKIQVPPPTPTGNPIVAPLAALSENWPEALKQEIELLDLGHAQVALPVNLIEPALKRGRVIFAWRDLRSWIQNAAVAVSAHDGVELELPLKVLTPLFFARQRAGAAGRKVSVSEEIPNLFFGFPQPSTPAPAPTPGPVPVAPVASVPPVDTNFFSRHSQPETSDSEFKRKGGTDFSSRAAAPADIVARAMRLPGVAGALIALPDGLKVASQIPAELNGDTLAAFLPQLFARVNQCSRELRMGDLNNLSFTVGSVPWKIFRVNAVYFAAFGRANEALPTAPLAALATELDRKNNK